MITPVHITTQAAAEIKNMMRHKNIPPDYALRVIAEGATGCGGVRYRLGFDKRKDDDQFYEEAGIEILYQKPQMMFLMGLEIDFEERQTEKGFVFNRK